MLKPFLIAYAARIRGQRTSHPDISEPALAPAFQRLLEDCLPHLPTAPNLSVIPEFNNPGVGRPDIALKRPGEPARAFVELKHPSKPADPARWTGAHDKRQYARFQTLGCWAASNFQAIHLFERDDEVAVATIVPKATLDPATSAAKADRLIAAQDEAPLVDLLGRLAQAQAPAAASAEELAANLAYAARLVRGIVAERLTELKAEGIADDPLQQVLGEFRDVLYAHPEAGGYTGASFDDLFAAAFAQTLGFGLLLVREASGQQVGDDAWRHMPPEHPLLRTTLRVLSEPEVRDGIGIGWTVMTDTVNSFAADLLVAEPGGRDPILYFYEDFLAVFDPKARERYGVYYTPVEVVRFMVGALDRALRDHLGKTGLADHGVTLLDPAVGTGTFLLGVAERVREQAIATAGPGMAHPELLDLARRMYGFELLVGPYAVAHYRLHHALRPPVSPGQPVPPPLPRLGVYLADTLARPGADAPIGSLGFTAGGIREERLEANRIKAQQEVLAIIGNPPYRRLKGGEIGYLVGGWMNDLWSDLKQPVINEGWSRALGTFPELSVAFWRWSLWKMFESDNAPCKGVAAFITNRTFLSGKPTAGLRKMLRERFSRILIVDLHGDINAGSRAGVYGDTGVFAIKVGTCITIAIADGDKKPGELADITYVDSWKAGVFSGQQKLAWLDQLSRGEADLSGVIINRGPMDDFKPVPFADLQIPSIKDTFIFGLSGIKTQDDDHLIAFDLPTLKQGVSVCLVDRDDPTFDNQVVAITAFRPLDNRLMYNDFKVIKRPRPALQAAFGQDNIVLYTATSDIGEGPAVWCHGLLPSYHSFRGDNGGFAFPLFDRRRRGEQVNISTTLMSGLSGAYGVPITPQNVFDAILALLSASSYTTLFAEDLEDVFPHVPFPADHATFLDAAAIGREIRAIETFARPPGAAFITPGLARVETTPSAGGLASGDWEAGEIRLRDDGTGRVSGIPDGVWRFGVSGYRLLPRWLAARQGRPVDAALIGEMRDVAGRIVELIHWFDRADLVLTRALADTLTREELGLTVPDETDTTSDDDDG